MTKRQCCYYSNSTYIYSNLTRCEVLFCETKLKKEWKNVQILKKRFFFYFITEKYTDTPNIEIYSSDEQPSLSGPCPVCILC